MNQPTSQATRSRRHRKRSWLLGALMSIGVLVLLVVLLVLWLGLSNGVEDTSAQSVASSGAAGAPPDSSAVDEPAADERVADERAAHEPATDPLSDDASGGHAVARDDAPLDVVELRSGRIWVPWSNTSALGQLWASAVPPYTAEAQAAFEARRRVAIERPTQWGTFEPIVDTSSLEVDYELNDERTDVAERIKLCEPVLGAQQPEVLTLSVDGTTGPSAAVTFAVAQHLVSRAVLSRGPTSLGEACVDAALASASRDSTLVGEVELLWARGIRVEDTAPAPAGAWVVGSEGDTTHLVVCHQPDTTYVADASTRERLVLLAELPERAEAVEIGWRDGAASIGEARLFAGDCAEGQQPNGEASRGAGYDLAAQWLRERREQASTSQYPGVWIEVDELDAWRTVVAARARVAGSAS